MEEARLKKYAELLVKAGGNVQKGQPVIIGVSVDDAAFARLAQMYAYEAGASEVIMDWADDASTRMHYLHAADTCFDEYAQWRVDRLKHYDDRGVVYLRISSSDPDLLNGVDKDRIKRYTKVSNAATKEHSKLTMSNAVRWSIIALPSLAWAKKVFPELPEAEAMDALWAHILRGARADGENPIHDWAKHKANFEERLNYLNGKAFKSLRFINDLGTDFTIGLPEGHIWKGGGDTAQDGVDFFPNLPTEEIFTAPHRACANGRVVASMPLSYQGNLIEDFELTFKDGRAVSWRASKNEDVLTSIIEMDEGAHYLGEVALVSNNSPIAQMNTLFYRTLFDENASCHLALGKAYPDTVRGGSDMNDGQLAAAGVNDSLVHVDFMFGTADMLITGYTAKGAEEIFFKDGEFLI
jgi:aminopeptidase